MRSKKFKKEKNYGQIYTPTYIVESILKRIGFWADTNSIQILEKHIIDPSCGDGAFLQSIVKEILKVLKQYNIDESEYPKYFSYVHGWELDAEEIQKCRENLIKITPYAKSVQLENVNSLTKKLTEFDEKLFDFIVGNPPYIKVENLDDISRVLLKKYQLSEDMYLAFIELSLSNLKTNGKLGFITPLWWKRSDNAIDFILNHKLIDIYEYGYSIFKKAAIITASFIIENDKSVKPSNTIVEWRTYSTIDNYNTVNLKYDNVKNGFLSKIVIDNKENIQKISKYKLKDICKSIHSIAGFTTSFDKYFTIYRNKMKIDGDYCIFAKDNVEWKIEKSVLVPFCKCSLLNYKEFIVDKSNSNKFVNAFLINLHNKDGLPYSESYVEKNYPLTYKYLSHYKDLFIKTKNFCSLIDPINSRLDIMVKPHINCLTFITKNRNIAYLFNVSILHVRSIVLELKPGYSYEKVIEYMNSDEQKEWCIMNAKKLTKRAGYKITNDFSQINAKILTNMSIPNLEMFQL